MKIGNAYRAAMRTGYSELSTTMIYAHISDDEVSLLEPALDLAQISS